MLQARRRRHTETHGDTRRHTHTHTPTGSHPYTHAGLHKLEDMHSFSEMSVYAIFGFRLAHYAWDRRIICSGVLRGKKKSRNGWSRAWHRTHPMAQGYGSGVWLRSSACVPWFCQAASRLARQFSKEGSHCMGAWSVGLSVYTPWLVLKGNLQERPSIFLFLWGRGPLKLKHTHTHTNVHRRRQAIHTILRGISLAWIGIEPGYGPQGFLHVQPPPRATHYEFMGTYLGMAQN